MYYIVGIPFKSEHGTHTTGDKIDEKVANKWAALEVLVNTGRLYRVHPDKGYRNLPPHVYSAVQRRAEVDKALALIKPTGELPETPEAVTEAIRLQEAEKKSREANKEAALKAREKAEGRRKYTRKPVEVPKKPEKTDSMKAEAEKEGTDFDPEETRQLPLKDLQADAKKRGIATTGTKAELAQRIIDDEISKNNE